MQIRAGSSPLSPWPSWPRAAASTRSRRRAPAPLRYRDAVFHDVTKTQDVSYGSAVDQHGATQST